MRHLRAAIVGTSLLLFLAAALTGALPPPLGAPVVRAASPAPSAGTGDTRTSGEAPGFVGAPLLAVAAVLALGGVAVVGTATYVRLTGGPGRPADDTPLPPKP